MAKSKPRKQGLVEVYWESQGGMLKIVAWCEFRRGGGIGSYLAHMHSEYIDILVFWVEFRVVPLYYLCTISHPLPDYFAGLSVLHMDAPKSPA